MNPEGSRPLLLLVDALGALAALLAVGGCDDFRAWRDDRAAAGARIRSPGAPAPLASVARLLGRDASDLEPHIDPPALAGDFESEVRAFTSLDECAKQHAGIDPIVADALEAIGYDTFLRDACRVLDAAQAKDATRCQAIDASSLRARCQATVAEILGTSEGCPWEIQDRPTRGRDPLCVALASHDVRLCRAVRSGAGRASCEAIDGRDDSPCAELPSTAQQERCARGARRWRKALAPATSSPAPLPPVAVGAGELRVEGDDAGASLAVNLGADLEHGVVILQQRDGLRFVIGPMSEAGQGFLATAPQKAATLAVEVFVRRGSSFVPAPGSHGDTPPSNAALVEKIELLLPGRSPLATPSAHASLVAVVDELEPTRGATLRFRVDGALENAGGHLGVHVRAVTFVRDVVTPRAIYGTEARALGGDGGMR